MLNKKVAADPDLFFCTQADCENVLNAKDASKDNVLACSKCKFEICVKCKKKSHKGLKCGEVGDEDRSLHQYVND